MLTVNPYLIFNGNCELAFDYYRHIFGGEFSYVSRFKEMPENPDAPVPKADLEKIMHISLPISKETVLMGSDSSEAFGQAKVQGDNFSLSLNTSTEDEARRVFDALAVNGKVNMPLGKTFWGAYFGMLTDQFGVHWMVDCVEDDKQK